MRGDSEDEASLSLSLSLSVRPRVSLHLTLVTKILYGFISVYSVKGGWRYLFSWQRPAFQEKTMVSAWRSSVVIEY